MNRRDLLSRGGALAASGFFGKAKAMAESGLYVPPEEAPHQRTFMQWPVDRRVYRDQVFLDMVQQTIAEVANAVAEF
ncbi:MAG: agmatine deiminase family protein, partial [Pseudomonadota bacterium]